MNKQNFFYPKRNNWDIGWPCSPRFFGISVIIVTSCILGLIEIF